MRVEVGSLATWVLNVIIVIDSIWYYIWEHRKGK
jgi:uncharacterized membrane protein YecN with MAPEG domain